MVNMGTPWQIWGPPIYSVLHVYSQSILASVAALFPNLQLMIGCRQFLHHMYSVEPCRLIHACHSFYSLFGKGVRLCAPPKMRTKLVLAILEKSIYSFGRFFTCTQRSKEHNLESLLPSSPCFHFELELLQFVLLPSLLSLFTVG